MMKAELREKYKQLRKALNNTERAELSEKIYQHFVSHFDFTHDDISIFIPIDRFQEVNTWLFIKEYPARFYLPIVKPEGLKHVQYESMEQLKKTSWGILEPQYGLEVNEEKFDVVIVPLLAFDKAGNRVGYGKGFYDGFLKNCVPNCKFIGVSYFPPEENLIETIPTDIRLHYCITPDKVYHFK
ncbi:5-formyltetrahydrofolate cyclo-ligase [Putridiphycobacter roseus]|uniref:5-formyltetrahydrofolate cyclo-ligase n=1 Tax=Putridiphycobacter roseus TaxID=2219161 RepID=A0A2W1NTW4_9FLAO|nr:5-formyltetrahydrofolate cyclo-ligase [Putridiphycobacter roseus]PZE18188.1 5-formyltetrahydrofolate cyclo-ligase [Putridiphycobacter roseus]